MVCKGPRPSTAETDPLRIGAGVMWAEAGGPQGSLQAASPVACDAPGCEHSPGQHRGVSGSRSSWGHAVGDGGTVPGAKGAK